AEQKVTLGIDVRELLSDAIESFELGVEPDLDVRLNAGFVDDGNRLGGGESSVLELVAAPVPLHRRARDRLLQQQPVPVDETERPGQVEKAVCIRDLGVPQALDDFLGS